MRKTVVVFLLSLLALYGCTGPKVFRIQPVQPISELLPLALAATPPTQTGNFREPDLVEQVRLDPTIHLDIRYAGSDNFLSTPLYSQARAFMQRPAAEALVQVQQALKRDGYGLLIHDAYRPWYITKIFWDATPADKKAFVADPTKGSRHNRGCAVDLTLYDLATGKPVRMPGVYDEMSERSHIDYPGGSAEERRQRQRLYGAMTAQGFSVYPEEWWHYDYVDWASYRIENLRFEDIHLITLKNIH